MTPAPTNLAASVHARLLNGARQRREDFNLTLKRYAGERFLYRLGRSPYRDRYVLKGAALFAVWGGDFYRATRDLDFTGYGSSEAPAVLGAFREICAIGAHDGLAFDPTTLAAETTKEDDEYDGLRIRFIARLGEVPITVQVDVGFGNAVEPPATEIEYPTLLDGSPPSIRAYPKEAVIAEKVHALVRFGERTSRLKDLYDLYVLAHGFAFHGQRLAAAIAATFERRRTAIRAEQPVALTPRFFADEARAAQWRAYLDRNQLLGAPADFSVVGQLLVAFLGPVWGALVANEAFGLTWQAHGLWGEATAASEGPRMASAHANVAGERRARVVQAAGPATPIGTAAEAAVGRFRRYPRYKDSGVEWLGEIPTHWEVKRLRSTVTSCQNGVWGDEPDGLRDIICVRVADFDRVAFKVDLTTPTLRSIEPGVAAARGLQPGDLLLEKSGGGENQPVGAVVLYDRTTSAVCSNFVARVTIAAGYDARFLTYLHAALYALRINTRHIKQSTGIQNLDSASYLGEETGLAPEPEQRAIAAFLGRETARIDALVAKKERLIELLQEKRIALIIRAVTKGLDPNLLMKDSGVAWLGEIPAHWELKKLSRLTECLDGRRVPLNAEERGRMQGDFPYWGANSIVDFVDQWLFDEELVLLGEDGAPFFDRTKSVAFHVSGKIWVNNHAHVLRPSRSVDPAFLAQALNCVDYRAFIDGTTRDKLTQGDLNSIPIQLPPTDEQRAIAAFLDRETARIDALVAKVRVAIEGLKELRTALISAAVTGKIDVREAA